jgi:hypothetical protein
MLRSSNWLGHSPFTGELMGSIPIRSTFASVAHMVEQLTCNQQVVGSSPTGSSKQTKTMV